MLIPYKQVAAQTELQNSQKSAADFFHYLEAAQVLTLVGSFSLTSFYPYQKVIINAILEKARQHCNTINWQRKSLCFQFPPVYLQKKAIVIMPTISLMRDQTIQVNEHGIKVALLAYMDSATKYQPATTEAFEVYI